jgi:hypothetical protein
VDAVRHLVVDRDAGAEALDAVAGDGQAPELQPRLHGRPPHGRAVGRLLQHRAVARADRLTAPHQHGGHLDAVAAVVVALLGADPALPADGQAALAQRASEGLDAIRSASSEMVRVVA